MPFSDRKVRVFGSREHYAADSALVIQQRYDEKEVILQIRRVVTLGNEELQIEIGLYKHGKKRTTQMSDSFVVPPQIADLIAEACTKVRGPK